MFFMIKKKKFTVMQSHVLHVSVYFVSNSACGCGWDIYQYRRSVLCLKLLSLHCSWIEHRLDQSYKYSLRHTHTINTPWRWAWAQSSLPNLIKQEINHYSTHTRTLTHFTTYTYTDSCTWTHSHKCKEITVAFGRLALETIWKLAVELDTKG